jgi:uncharacterized protein (TIGR03437 family)
VRVSVFFLLAFACPGAQVVYQKSIPANLVAVDPSGNVYVTGGPGVTKLDSAGNIVYSKPVPVVGDWYAIAADAMGNLIIAGDTTSDNLPTSPGVIQPKRNASGVCITGDKSAQRIPCPDAFVAKINVNGDLAWASYLGGSAQDHAYGIAVDGRGDIYVTGLTQSTDFPTISAFQKTMGGYADVFVAKISGDGTQLVYSSFVGGAGYDIGKAVAVDAAGNAYFAGTMQGAGLPAAPGGFGTECLDLSPCGFLIKVAPAGDRVVFGGYFGAGSRASEATAVTVDGEGNVYVGGDAVNNDFVAKVSADGARMVFSTSFPGASFGIYSIAVDPNGAIYAAGTTASNSMPIFGPALQPCAGPSGLVYYFLLKMKADGSGNSYFSYEESATRMALAADGSVYEANGSSLRKLAGLENPGGPYLSRVCVMNGASYVSHLQYGQPGVSPGELVMLTGTGLEPVAASSGGGAQVFFDGVPAPLVYVQDRQINAVAPYEIAGKAQTSIQVMVQGQATPAVTIPVSAISAAPFLDPATGPPLVFNQDFSRNSIAHPAAQGSVVVIYTTGAGQTSPASVDGQVWQAAGALQTPVAAQIQNININPLKYDAPVVYAGPVPGVVSAVQQFNILIPPNLPPAFFTAVTSGNAFIFVTIGSQTVAVPVAVK